MTMNNEHDPEALDLYALGALDEEQAAKVARHVRDCDLCARRLGDAERTVTAMLERDYAPRSRSRAYIGIGAAAALLLWILPLGLLGGEVGRLHAVQLADATAVSALVHSHFLHVPFRAVAANAPHAKVLYGRSDPWLYVVADGSEPLEVRVVQAGSPLQHSVGTLRSAGGESSLFARTPHVRDVLLVRDGKTVARARLIGKDD